MYSSGHGRLVSLFKFFNICKTLVNMTLVCSANGKQSFSEIVMKKGVLAQVYFCFLYYNSIYGKIYNESTDVIFEFLGKFQAVIGRQISHPRSIRHNYCHPNLHLEDVDFIHFVYK